MLLSTCLSLRSLWSGSLFSLTRSLNNGKVWFMWIKALVLTLRRLHFHSNSSCFDFFLVILGVLSFIFSLMASFHLNNTQTHNMHSVSAVLRTSELFRFLRLLRLLPSSHFEFNVCQRSGLEIRSTRMNSRFELSCSSTPD